MSQRRPKSKPTKKPKPKIITKADVQKFLATESDFAFELNVLRQFSKLRCACSHGGYYNDPVTGVARQFDIRALIKSEDRALHLAIECKNISRAFPIVMHRVLRPPSESFHDVIINVLGWTFRASNGVNYGVPASSLVRRIFGQLYVSDHPVGRALDRIHCNGSGEIVSDDSEVFNKFNQAIQSSRDMVSRAHTWGEGGHIMHFIVPIVVIPDRRLWVVDYDHSGAASAPKLAKRASFHVSHVWNVERQTAVGAIDNISYKISHLEFVTISAIEEFLEDVLGRSVEYQTPFIQRTGREALEEHFLNSNR